MAEIVLQSGAVLLRHIKAGTGDGQQTILGRAYVPSWAGINGARGFAQGQYELRLNEEGTFELTLPNGAGEDGVLHRDRFLVLSKGRRTPQLDTATGALYYAGGTYRPGDEWLEVWWPHTNGELLFVGTPTAARVDGTQVVVRGVDAYWLLRKARETAAGFWRHAPRDVFEHYTQVWQVLVADEFSNTSRFSYSAGYQNTSDGLWRYQATEPDPDVAEAVRIRPGGFQVQRFLNNGEAYRFPVGLASSEPHTAWRVEATLRVPALPAGSSGGIGLIDTDELSHRVYLAVLPPVSGTGEPIAVYFTQGTTQARATLKPGPLPGPYALAIEGRGEWIYFYVNGALVGVRPMLTGNYSLAHSIWHTTGTDDNTTTMTVLDAVARRTRPFLMRGTAKGDYHLPGLPPSGGLQGNYYNDQDIRADSDFATLRLNPTREPYARRLDRAVDITYAGAANSTSRPPVGLAGTDEYFSVRWLGAINLDLAATDVLLRANYLGQYVRCYVGKTRAGEHYFTGGSTGGSQLNATGASLRTHLGGSVKGWYPLVVEYARTTDVNWLVQLQYSTNGGSTWAAVPPTMLSPVGIFDQQVRHESHYDQIKVLADTYGLQFQCVPQQLEGGEFPGRLVPYGRVGRDTEKVLDVAEATDFGVEISAEEVADVLLADASGIADPRQAAQLTAEALNWDEVGLHLFQYTEYEQLSEITIRELLANRLASMVALRGSAWEQVGANPRGHRELLDKFQLGGDLLEFKWAPGDGLRLRLPEIGVEDERPRQIVGLTQPFVPGGLQQPNVSFRQRPRSLGEMLRRLRREYLNNARYYQGQLVTVNGSVGSTSGAGGADIWSRVPLPNDLTDVVRATLVVLGKSDTSMYTINVNDTATGIPFYAPGRYDITQYVNRATGTEHGMLRARGVAGTGTCTYHVELLVRV